MLALLMVERGKTVLEIQLFVGHENGFFLTAVSCIEKNKRIYHRYFLLRVEI